MIKYWMGVVLLAFCGVVVAQQKPIKIVNTTSLSKACNPKGVPTNGAHVERYTCTTKKGRFDCDLYIFTGYCFGVVMFDEKKEFVQVDIIKFGGQYTVWSVETASR